MYSSFLTLYSLVGDAIPKITVLWDADNESSPHWNREIRTVHARAVYGGWSSPCLKDMGRKTRSSTGYLGLWKYDESRNAEGSGEGGPASRALMISHDEIQIHCLDIENGKRNIILNMWRRVTRMGRRQADLGLVTICRLPVKTLVSSRHSSGTIYYRNKIRGNMGKTCVASKIGCHSRHPLLLSPDAVPLDL